MPFKYNLISCLSPSQTTPSKDAVTTSRLAVKSGYLMKRNEQGNWQQRYVCIVPHCFLYYFDEEGSESPRGIIDLEIYTNISREENTLKMESFVENTR